MEKIKRETECDKCEKLFYRKLRPGNNGRRQLTQVNDITYWTEGKPWGTYRILCRGCLNDWFEKYRGDFQELITPTKLKLYYHYRYLGMFKKEKEQFKGE